MARGATGTPDDTGIRAGKALICGTLAYDTIMVFRGRWREHFRAQKSHALDVSFPYEELRTDFGGSAGNVAYQLKNLGLEALPLATVGPDAEPYALWLDQWQIPRRHLAVVEDAMTPRAYIMTDLEDSQITAFHAGASLYAADNSVSEAVRGEREGAAAAATLVQSPDPQTGEAAPAAETTGRPEGSAAWRAQTGSFFGFPEYEERGVAQTKADPKMGVPGAPGPVTIGAVLPDAPEAMVRHGREFADTGVPFLFDPGQQVLHLREQQLRTLIDQAEWVAANDYEADILIERSGLSRVDIADRLAALIVTGGSEGSTIYADGREISIPAARPHEVVDPTGAGDAYRAGILFGLMKGHDWDLTGRVASLMGALAVEHFGAQGLWVEPKAFQLRMAEAFS